MYFWKCWRDTRYYFLIFLISGMAIIPISTPIVGRTSISEAGLVDIVATMPDILAIVAAFGLSTQAASEEFAEKAIHFLFAKPRTRSHFVWVAWSIGLLELVTVIGGTALAGWIFLAHLLTSSPLHALLALANSRSLLDHLVSSFMLYCLTYAITAMLRNGRTGLGLSVLLVIGIQALATILHVRWHITLPLPPGAIGSLPLTVSIVIWILLALALVATAQIVLERAEI